MPKLSKIARTFLLIAATSVESERAFSKAGLTLTNRRINLGEKKLDTYIFISQNKKNDEIDDDEKSQEDNH